MIDAQQCQFIRFPVPTKDLLNIIAYLWLQRFSGHQWHISPQTQTSMQERRIMRCHRTSECRTIMANAYADCWSWWLIQCIWCSANTHRRVRTHTRTNTCDLHNSLFHGTNTHLLYSVSMFNSHQTIFRFCGSFFASSLFWFGFQLVVCELSFSLPQTPLRRSLCLFRCVRSVANAEYQWRISSKRMNQCTFRCSVNVDVNFSNSSLGRCVRCAALFECISLRMSCMTLDFNFRQHRHISFQLRAPLTTQAGNWSSMFRNNYFGETFSRTFSLLQRSEKLGWHRHCQRMDGVLQQIFLMIICYLYIFIYRYTTPCGLWKLPMHAHLIRPIFGVSLSCCSFLVQVWPATAAEAAAVPTNTCMQIASI